MNRYLRAYGLRRCPKCHNIFTCNSYYFPFLTKRVRVKRKWKVIECKDALCWECEKSAGKGRLLKGILAQRQKKAEYLDALDELNAME